MSLTCRRELVIVVDDGKVTVYADHQSLRCISGDLSDLSSNRKLIDFSNTETKLFRQDDNEISIEMDIEKFVIFSEPSIKILTRFEYEPRVNFNLLNSK